MISRNYVDIKTIIRITKRDRRELERILISIGCDSFKEEDGVCVLPHVHLDILDLYIRGFHPNSIDNPQEPTYRYA